MKILSGAALDRVLEDDAIRVASGHFDPVLASHARRLAANGRPLLVLITEPENPLLSARARAELVAALDVVDHVGIATPEMVGRVPAHRIVRNEPDDRRDRSRLAKLVRDRR
jgi:hypothetical protein